jgi:hypothetical protein
MQRSALVVFVLILAGMACAPAEQPGATRLPDSVVFEAGRAAYGFFPSPPEPSFVSVLSHFRDLGEHADFILIQPAIPWEAMLDPDAEEAQPQVDIRNQVTLASQNGLGAIFVVDPLNGLNRREFMGLPPDWEASFANPDARRAFTEFALWITREFRPRYLGLASEINTYADAHPDDFPHFLSLYREVYAAAKDISPETQVFVTFQWEDLNNIFPEIAEGRRAYDINWDQVEAFEPELDVWVISSYPFVAFSSGADIRDDYYTPLLDRTNKPLALGEGGYTSKPIGPFPGAPSDQVLYLEAIHSQIGQRLAFWTYLLLSDFDPEAYADAMRHQGRPEADINTLGMFQAVGLRQADGSAKPALAVWDSFRESD